MRPRGPGGPSDRKRGLKAIRLTVGVAAVVDGGLAATTLIPLPCGVLPAETRYGGRERQGQFA